MKDATSHGTGDDTQTSRGIVHGTIDTVAILAIAKDIDPSGVLQKALSKIYNGDIVVPENISKDVARAIFPDTLLISSRHVLRRFNSDATWSTIWHQDVADKAVDIGNGVMISPLGCNALIAYDKQGASRLTANEISAVNDDDDFINMLTSGTIPMQMRVTLSVPNNIEHMSSKERLEKGYDFTTTGTDGRVTTFGRNTIHFLEIAGYNGELYAGFDKLTSSVVFARKVRKSFGETFKFRSISKKTLLQVLKATKVRQLVADWKKLEATFPNNVVHRAKFGKGHRADAFSSFMTSGSSTTSSTGHQGVAAYG